MQETLGLTKRKRYLVTIEHEGKKDRLVVIAHNPEGMNRIVNKLYDYSINILKYDETDL